ncbi:PREDICTED: uncharacterized protein LOC104817362 [Tarenaya hassleriana]|uniref:uncharacterized protein LOC104817362 n=1 Tax=Tarenaya hassleriana TaxID=28532 RepID=UPI00053CA6F6|nr:PREDICTED: uncharacterized protein LOC104817362 [Tarenaya hassleriana]
MEVLSSALPNGSFNSSSFSSKLSWKVSDRKNRHRFYVPISKFRHTRSSPCYFAPTLKVSARLGVTSRRRNSLRKKLIGDQSLRLNPNSSDAGTKPRNPDRSFDHSVEGSGDLVELTNTEGLKEGVPEDSNLLNELENWVSQYKKEAEYWGIGSSPIFTVFQGSDGKVERVDVDKDEILRRRQAFEDLPTMNSKVIYAKKLAEQMENGENVIRKDSSVAKFVSSKEEFHFFSSVHNAIPHLDLVHKLPAIGGSVICSFVAFWVLKLAFKYGNSKEMEYPELEKQMMRRKMKAWKEKEALKKGTVEVLREDVEETHVSFERPKLDQQKLMSSISRVKGSRNNLEILNSSQAESSDFNDKIHEIKTMARRAREIEAGGEPDEQVKGFVDGQAVEDGEDTTIKSINTIPSQDLAHSESKDEDEGLRVSAEKDQDNAIHPPRVVVPEGNRVNQDSPFPNHDLAQTHAETENSMPPVIPANKIIQSSDPSKEKPFMKKNGTGYRPRVIRSVKEAKEFLSNRSVGEELCQEPSQMTIQDRERFSKQQGNNDEEPNGVRRRASEELKDKNKNFDTTSFDGMFKLTLDSDSSGNFLQDDKDTLAQKNDGQEFIKPGHKDEGPDKEGKFVNSLEGLAASRKTAKSSLDNEHKEMEQAARRENWMEKNFHEFGPIVEKMRTGFRDNYMAAREKESLQSSTITDIAKLYPYEDDDELEWMKDDKLRDIVFRVRDNELAGRDPFYSVDAEDKAMFFQGLENKVEKVNEKLSHLHQWLHSNIENLDYGVDGISLHDPPEKIIPRWKGPPLEKSPDFLNNYHEQRSALFSGKSASETPVKKEEQSSLQNPAVSGSIENISTSSTDSSASQSKIVIEGSDGSIRPGKKSGTEFWQHTKKWSRGFLELYNAETDPEVKAVMRDMGKDLDRWITEEEIKDAAEVMDKLPDKNKKVIEKKLNKLRREMELFGPQAVVSKYREYGQEKEEDYLWWLDLPHVLCLELYTVDDGEQRVGFYALEMAADLELEPKPHHVIAFEDASDCKNLAYIIQAHLDMLGKGNVFIVPRPPKDAFREAKANGFGVTVIRKGELKLNVDQPLEEVEEQICEIGSKMYHEKIMGERSVDISSLMKGVFNLKSKPTGRRKRSKRILEKGFKPSNNQKPQT